MARTIQSLERAAAMLRLLAGGERRLGLSDISSSLGLAKGTAHGILRTLQQVGFVEQDAESGKYQLGAALLHMGSSYLDGNELRTRALNWADALAGRSGESVWIGMLHEDQVLVIHHVFRPDDSMQVLQVGMMLATHATAIGKVLLAFDPYAEACTPMLALTTIRNPIEQTATEALRILDDQMAGLVHTPVHLVLGSELVERSSA